LSAAQGIATLVKEIRRAPIEPGMPVPRVLIVCPPRIRQPKGDTTEKYRGAEQRTTGLDQAYKQVASDLKCDFFDAETVATVSAVDGVHLDADQHLKLGNALAGIVEKLLVP